MNLKKPKIPKIGAPKVSIPKIAAPRIKRPKRKLPMRLLIIIVLTAMAAAGFGIIKGIGFKDLLPDKTEESADAEQGKKTENESGAGMAGLENHLASDFLKTLKSGKYTIRYRTTTVYNGESFEVETTYAVNGKSITLISGDRATVVRDGRVYMLDHTNKRILSWDVTKSNDLERIETDGLRYIGSSEADGTVCEDYAAEATQLKLYFRGEKLVRIVTALNKQDAVMDIIEVSDKAPENLFEVPKDYMTTVID